MKLTLFLYFRRRKANHRGIYSRSGGSREFEMQYHLSCQWDQFKTVGPQATVIKAPKVSVCHSLCVQHLLNLSSGRVTRTEEVTRGE